MASRDNPTTESPRQDEAQHGYEEHVQSGAEARGAGLEVQQAVVAGAHEQSMAAAEEASKALHSGGVPKDTPGMGDAVEVSVHLPTAEEWEEALHPRAVEPAQEHVVTTDVDPGTKMGATEWPGQGLRVAPVEEQAAAWPPKMTAASSSEEQP